MNVTRPLAVLALAAGLHAQRNVWIVDSQGRPGHDFTDLPAAIAAASDGDVLDVLDGSYTGFDTNKAVTILGRSGATLATTASTTVGIRIHSIPADAAFVMSGFDVNPFFGVIATTPILIEDCEGRVVIDGFVGTRASFWPTRLGRIADSRQVSVSNSRLRGGPALTIENSTVRFTDSELDGHDAFISHGISPSSAAVAASNSELLISRTNFEGGAEAAWGSFAQPASAGIEVTGSSIRLTGVAGNFVRSGHVTKVAGVSGSGRIAYDPRVMIQGAPPIAGLTASATLIPSLRAQGAPLGGTVQVDLVGTPSAAAGLFAGLPGGGRTPIPGFGDVWFDLRSAPVLAAGGMLDAQGRLTTSVSVPLAPSLFGVEFGWQGIVQDSQPARLSNFAGYVHGR